MKPFSSIMQPANTTHPVQPVLVGAAAYAEREVSWSGGDEPMSVMGAPQVGPGRKPGFAHGRAPGRERAPSIRVDFRLTAARDRPDEVIPVGRGPAGAPCGGWPHGCSAARS